MIKGFLLLGALLLSGCASLTPMEQQALQTGFAQGLRQSLDQNLRYDTRYYRFNNRSYRVTTFGNTTTVKRIRR